jgi:hypothetical protein
MAETAITGPSGRSSTGRLAVSHPSTRSYPSCGYGANIHGIPIEALTATESCPSRKTIDSQVCISVDVIVSGIRVSAKDFPSNIVSRNVSIFFHLMSHLFMSKSTSLIQSTEAMISSISYDVRPSAKSAAMIAPILVPDIALGDISCSSIYLSTPICESPRAHHHPSAMEHVPKLL